MYDVCAWLSYVFGLFSFVCGWACACIITLCVGKGVLCVVWFAYVCALVSDGVRYVLLCVWFLIRWCMCFTRWCVFFWVSIACLKFIVLLSSVVVLGGLWACLLCVYDCLCMCLRCVLMLCECLYNDYVCALYCHLYYSIMCVWCV